MVKVYYTVELPNGVNYLCLLELNKYQIGKDYATAFYDDNLVFTVSSIKEFLLSKHFHIDVSDDRIINSKYVTSIFGVSFGT